MAGTETELNIPDPVIMAAKVPAIGAVFVLTRNYWNAKEPKPIERTLIPEALPETLRNILGLLNAPLHPSSDTILTLSYQHERDTGLHFRLQWSPNGSYERGFVKIKPDVDPSVIANVVTSTRPGLEATGNERIVRHILTNPENVFLQARVIGACAALLLQGDPKPPTP